MWFVFMATDNKGTLELRKQARSQHLERLQQLRREGRLLVAAPARRLPVTIRVKLALPAPLLLPSLPRLLLPNNGRRMTLTSTQVFTIRLLLNLLSKLCHEYSGYPMHH